MSEIKEANIHIRADSKTVDRLAYLMDRHEFTASEIIRMLIKVEYERLCNAEEK